MSDVTSASFCFESSYRHKYELRIFRPKHRILVVCAGGENATLHKKRTIHQVTTMLTTCKNLAGARAIIKVLDHQYQCLAGGYDLEIGQF